MTIFKKSTILSALILLIITTSACQPTPEEPIVVNKSNNIVKEVQNAAQKQESSESEPDIGNLVNLVFPEHYTYNSENEAASLTINVDADVYKPESDRMPFARVTPWNFTQETVTGMFNYLFPDEKPNSSQPTKAILEEIMLHYEQAIANGYDGQPLSDEEKAMLEQELGKLREDYKTAPEQPVISDGTLQYIEHTGTTMVQDAEGEMKEKQVTKKYYELSASLDSAFLNINVSADESSPGSSLWYTNIERNYSTDGMIRVKQGDTLPEAVQDKLTIPLEDAVAMADGFFDAAGMDDVGFFAAYLVDDHGTGHVDDNWDPASHYAYKLFYTHRVNDVPVSCHESHGAGTREYKEPWYYESITFLISDDGILEINWHEPCIVSEIVEDNTEIIDFDNAMQKFESAVGYTYGQYLDYGEGAQASIEVVIDNIQLNLIRLREMDKPDEKAGLYVPAYVFYGYVKETCVYEKDDYVYEGYKTSNGGGNDFYPGPFMVMAINAVDGSIINTMSDIN